MSPSILSELEALTPVLYGDDEGASSEARSRRDALLGELVRQMKTSTAPPETPMKFGTSGWRGLLLHDFTIENVACVTEALVDTLERSDVHAALGVTDNDDLRRRGCVLAHDTRIMGPEFVDTAARVLLAHDIPVMVLGLATTPEVSAAIAETGAAFSINFTPSHNPFHYHGFKFNPKDGGPATKELTAPVTARATEILNGDRKFRSLSSDAFARVKTDGATYRTLDPIALYRSSLARRLPWFDLPRLIERINQSDLEIYVDNGFGASRGKYERLLAGVLPGRLHVLNGGEDYLFGGKSREPSVENYRALSRAMAGSPARLTVGIMNDGDGNRFVGGGRESALVMNQYGPLVVRHLVHAYRLAGDVTRSVMTSHMAEAALRRYLPKGVLHETAVGFQHMKEYIGLSVNSWEESDGMSPLGWSRDKDGLLAALLLLDMVLDRGLTPEALLSEIEAELGVFLFQRRKVVGNKSGEALTRAIADRFGSVRAGDVMEIAGRPRKVAKVVTLDGTKIIFDDGAWFGVRASGTEPVSRPYVEVPVPEGASTGELARAREEHARMAEWLSSELARVVA